MIINPAYVLGFFGGALGCLSIFSLLLARSVFTVGIGVCGVVASVVCIVIGYGLIR